MSKRRYTVEEDDSDIPSLITPGPLFPPREKRPISDKQRDNLKKGMEALRAKRNALRDEQEQESTAVEQPPEPSPQPERRTRMTPVQASQQLQRSALKLPTQPPVREKQQRVVERVVEKQVDRVVSGSALLDALFFNKK